MTILELTSALMQMHSQHGNLTVKLECMEIKHVEYVRAISGEHGSFVDLATCDEC